MFDHNSLEDPPENIIHRFKHHPSILAINKKKFENIFEFHYVDQEEVTTEIKKLDPKKTTTGISIAMLQENVDICAPILTEIFNDCIKNGTFANELKLADITPIFKSIDSTAKKNYRPISILRSVSKLFEKLIQTSKSVDPLTPLTLIYDSVTLPIMCKCMYRKSSRKITCVNTALKRLVASHRKSSRKIARVNTALNDLRLAQTAKTKL